MWRDKEEEAILIGLDLNYFWSLTPKQWAKHVKVFNEKEKQRVTEIDKLNYLLGKYIGWAVNDPKHYPNKPFTEEEKQERLKVLSDKEMEKMAILNTQIMGGVIK